MTMPTSILYVHSSAASYGSDNALHDMIAHLDRQRFRVWVAVPQDGPLVPRLEALGVTVIRLPLAVIHRRHSPLFWLRFLARLTASALHLARVIRAQQIALVHSNTSHVLSGALAALVAGVPHLWQIRENTIWRSPLASPMRWLIAATSSRVVCVSDSVREHLAPSPSLAKRVRVLWDGIDIARFNGDIVPGAFRASLGLNAAQPLVGLVGRIVSWKGHALFIEAAARVHASHPEVRFVIVGEDLTKYCRAFKTALRRRIDELGLEDVVIFTGFRSDIPQVMTDLDVLAMLSESPEAWGLVVLEAMAAGTAVIASSLGGPLDTVRAGETGLLVPVGDLDALVQGLQELIEQPERRRAMGRAGRQRVIDLFRVEETGVAFTALYEEMLGQP